MKHKLPEAFLARIKEQLKDEYDGFVKTYDENPRRGIRINTLKISADDAVKRAPFNMEPVPWVKNGFFISGDDDPAGHPFYRAGLYYIQEPSAMTPADRLPIDKGDRVLDLCAAPGGKATALAAKLEGTGMLLANDASASRCRALLHNLELSGTSNIIVTNEIPQNLEKLFPQFFDKIMVDAPCSGEGMFRKDAKAVADWSENVVNLCSARQKRILADVWPALRRGGCLIYSTCTFEDAENDSILEWVAGELGGRTMEHDCSSLPGVIQTRTGGLLVPGFVKGEGQFVAALQKCTGTDGFRSRGKPASAVTERRKGNLLIHIPESIAREVAVLETLHPVQAGVAKGELRGHDFVPSADWALSLALPRGAYPVANLDLETALKFLHRDCIFLNDAPKGFLLVCFAGHPLGFVKNLGSRCNNLHPQGRKIKMDV